ncbi:hypothetical protein HPP92_006969 [Vanilla planifolia]|uniref:Uncharacterized protein n=1 Tax=Vanilla planifolia TaxID=51239 RepID=A0A835RCZ3_VANPL|nr:hypothetical protein HPP92_006969 [Vanilla planifolia]
MSRCFPFPPPGYENKPRTENIDLLIKEKHKEKKHKKDKRDKEKREHKEKREKDQSKDKHKEKKDRKEKHRDRKKDNDGEKGSVSEDRRVENRIEGKPCISESRPKVEEAKDSKLMEELCRRTKDEGAANRLVGDFTNCSTQRNIGGFAAAAASPKKETIANNKMVSVDIGSIQRRNGGSDLPIGNVPSSQQKKTWNISNASSMESERAKMREKTTFGSGVSQSRYHGVSRQIQSTSGLVDRKITGFAAEMEKEKFVQDEVASIPSKPEMGRGKIGTNLASSSSLTSIQRRNDAFGPSVENMFSVHSKGEGRSSNSIHGGIVQVDKGRAKGCEVFQIPVSSDPRRLNPICPPVEKDGPRETKAKDRKGKDEEHGEKKTKAKDKKEEKIVKKADDVEHNKPPITFGRKEQASNKPSIIGVDGNTKKRMGLETNGFLHENVARHDKKPRITPTTQPLLNGRKIELHPSSSPSNLPLKPPYKEHIPITGFVANGDISMKAPHPDAKHLGQVYSVPKMEDWPEVDNQEWLFDNRNSPQMPNGGEAPQVWAQAVWIDSPDFFALPYVVPF